VPPPRAERRRQEREAERQRAAGEQRRRSAALVAAKVAGPAPARPAPAPPGKVRATFHLPGELLNLARDAVVALSGPPHRLTLATLAERAIRTEVERLQREHHGGKPFPKRADELKGGRPIS
jgi:hypothetical protein